MTQSHLCFIYSSCYGENRPEVIAIVQMRHDDSKRGQEVVGFILCFIFIYLTLTFYYGTS